jgi:hypothetical protein
MHSNATISNRTHNIVHPNAKVAQIKVFLDPFLRELLDEERKFNIIIFRAALFFGLFFGELLKMLRVEKNLTSNNF